MPPQCQEKIIHKYRRVEAYSKPSEASQDIKVIPGDPSRVLKIGPAFSATEKTKITTLLRENQDVFAWKHKDMPGIDREIIQHCLNVNPKYKPVQ